MPNSSHKRFVKPLSPLGWLYVVNHPNAPDLVKIGITERPVGRMKELDNPKILAMVTVFLPKEKEDALHTKYRAQRLPQSEYFQLSDVQLDHLLSACEDWHKKVQSFVVNPHIPDERRRTAPSIKAQPLGGWPEEGEDLGEFMRKQAEATKEGWRKMEERDAQAKEYMRVYREEFPELKPKELNEPKVNIETMKANMEMIEKEKKRQIESLRLHQTESEDQEASS